MVTDKSACLPGPPLAVPVVRLVGDRQTDFLSNSKIESWLSMSRRATAILIPSASSSMSAARVVIGGDPEHQVIGIAHHRDAGAQLQRDRRNRQQPRDVAAHHLQPAVWAADIGCQRHDAALRQTGEESNHPRGQHERDVAGSPRPPCCPPDADRLAWPGSAGCAPCAIAGSGRPARRGDRAA